MSQVAKQVASIVCELRRQGWEVEKTNDNVRYRAKPPDSARKIVVFAAHPYASSLLLILRDLRHQGFEFPAPEAPRRTATPFAPVPHPDVTVEDNDEEEQETMAPKTETKAPRHETNGHANGTDGATYGAPPLPAPAPPSPPKEPLDRLFEQLKEAKELVAIARKEHVNAKDVFDTAKGRLAMRESELKDAERELAEKYKAFDECLKAAV